MHNGGIPGFDKMKRQLLSLVGDEAYEAIDGTTDSEVWRRWLSFISFLFLFFRFCFCFLFGTRFLLALCLPFLRMCSFKHERLLGENNTNTKKTRTRET